MAALLYPAVEAALRAAEVRMLWWSKGRFEYLSPVDWCLVLVTAIMLAPVVEELFFRGYVLTALLERLGRALLAVLTASLVFASIHVLIGPGAMAYIFLWSLISSYLYLRTGSLYPAMLMHALNNVFAYAILPALM